MYHAESSRFSQYKNIGKDIAQKSTRRDETVTIRKDKREDLLSKRRNLDTHDESACSSEQMETESRNNWDRIIALVRSDVTHDKLASVREACIIMSSEPNPPIDELITSGILPILVDCLVSDDVNLQYEAAWVLTNIASGTSEQTQAVVDAGAVPSLIELLSNDNIKVCEQALWALGNIVGDGPHNRDYCLQLGILPSLLNFIVAEVPVRFTRNIAWVLVNICRYSDRPVSPQMVRTILSGLCLLIKHQDSVVLTDALGALSFLAEGGCDNIQLVIDSGIVPSLVPMLGHADTNVQTAAVRAAGSIVTWSDDQTQFVLDCGVLDEMPQLLTHQNNETKKEATWLISNIVAGNHSQVQAVLNANLMPLIVKLLSVEDFSVQKEAAWVVSNLTISGRPDQVKHILNCGVIQPLCTLLDCKEPQTIQIVLSSINNILKISGAEMNSIRAQIEECGGLEKIEHLQYHDNEEIYQLVCGIIDTHFNSNTDDQSSSGQDGVNQQPWQGWSLDWK